MTLESPDSPHDRLAKVVFRRESGARALLSVGLPAEIRSRLDLSKLAFEPGELFSADLALSIADLVMTAPLVDGTGPLAFAFVLFEHLSAPHRMAVADLLIDAGRLWDDWRRRHPAATSIPRIVPIVLHHGPGGFSAPKKFRDLLIGDDATARAFRARDPIFPVTVIDLATADPSLAREVGALDAFAGAALALMRDARTARALEGLLGIGDLLVTVLRGAGGAIAFRQLLMYYLVVNEQGGKYRQGADRVIAKLRSILPEEYQIPANSLAAELIEQGIEKGIEKGIERGVARTIQAVLEQRFGTIDGALASRLRHLAADVEDERLARLVVVASTCASTEEFERALDS
jgi:hypothetical protein